MCGRYTITMSPQQLALRFGATDTREELRPRYNATPTQQLPVILNEDPSRIALLRWGLVPFWAKDPAIGSRPINARVAGPRRVRP